MEKPIWNRRGVLAWTAPPHPKTPQVLVSKELKFTERFNARFIATFSNIMNHPWFTDPYLDLFDQADFGSIYNGVSPTGNIQINSPRQIEFGLRIGF